MTFPPALKTFLQRWVVNTLGVLVAANIIRGITYDTLAGLFVASLLLGIFNAVLRPIMVLLSLPLVIVTLGLFSLVINGLLLYLVSLLVTSFHISGFWSAFFGAVIISLISLTVNILTGSGQARVEIRREKRDSKSDNDKGGGPVIDV